MLPKLSHVNNKPLNQEVDK